MFKEYGLFLQIEKEYQCENNKKLIFAKFQYHYYFFKVLSLA